MLDHLEAGIGHTSLEVIISENRATLRTISPGPCENGREDNKSLLLVLVLMERLAKNLNDLLSLVEVSTADKINDDRVCAADALAKSLRLALTIDNLDLLVRGWDCAGILLDKRTRELVGFLAITYGLMVVTHLLEESVSDQTVDARDEDALSGLLRLFLDTETVTGRVVTTLTASCGSSSNIAIALSSSIHHLV